MFYLGNTGGDWTGLEERFLISTVGLSGHAHVMVTKGKSVEAGHFVGSTVMNEGN